MLSAGMESLEGVVCLRGGIGTFGADKDGVVETDELCLDSREEVMCMLGAETFSPAVDSLEGMLLEETTLSSVDMNELEVVSSLQVLSCKPRASLCISGGGGGREGMVIVT